MWASRFHGPGAPLALERVRRPAPGPGEVLVEVHAAGLCGSDVHIAIEGTTPTARVPITLGHESAGMVAALGDGVEGWAPGARVVVSPLIACGTCPRCRVGRFSICERRTLVGIHVDGGLAEYLAVPADTLVALPDAVSFEVGAIITDAVATPYHALQDRAVLRAGESVAVVGVGGLGQHAVQLARLMGASTIVAVDVRPAALDRALAAGATHAVDGAAPDVPARVRAAAGGAGVDVAAEFVGLARTVETAVACTRPGGRVVVAGIAAEPFVLPTPSAFVRDEIALLGSYGFTKASIEQLVDLAAAGRLDLEASVTHRFALAQADDALRVLHTKAGDPGRVVVLPRAGG
jgi:2-desacetyl-2-hydroxyethyl bacteriochlorophyllide A dehydrogenase